MKNVLPGMLNDESGAVVVNNALIAVILPIFCILMLIAAGILMVTGASLVSAPDAIMEMFGGGLFSR